MVFRRTALPKPQPNGRSRKMSRKRSELRDQLWPDSGKQIWDRRVSKGFTTIPRTLPLVMRLIKELAKKGDPSTVYFSLWARNFDEAILTIDDEQDWAYFGGCSGTRAVRTWREHIFALTELKFIETKKMGNREYAQILVLNPYNVCAQLKSEHRVAEEWWNAFVHYTNKIGADVVVEKDA